MGKVILTSSHLPLPLPSPPLRRVPIRISLSSRSRRARPSPHQPSPLSPGTYLSVPQVECLLSLSPSDGNGMMVPFRSENRLIPVVRIARSGEYEFGWLEGESDIAPRPEKARHGRDGSDAARCTGCLSNFSMSKIFAVPFYHGNSQRCS